MPGNSENISVEYVVYCSFGCYYCHYLFDDC